MQILTPPPEQQPGLSGWLNRLGYRHATWLERDVIAERLVARSFDPSTDIAIIRMPHDFAAEPLAFAMPDDTPFDSLPLPEDVSGHAMLHAHEPHLDGRSCGYHYRLGRWTHGGRWECTRDHSPLGVLS